MAKKSPRIGREHSVADAAIQFRPGKVLGGLIEAKSIEWGLSRNETARRLTALAANGLDFRDHQAAAEMAEAMYPGADVADAANRISIELLAVEATRHSLGQPSLDEGQRRKEIAEIVQRCVLLAVPFEEPEQESRRVRIKQFRGKSD
jgi:hypothetical protein